MMFTVARVMVISGIGFFCLRGVLGLMSPAGLAASIVLLLVGAAAFERLCTAGGTCPIGQLACREGLLSSDGVAHILSLQRQEGGRFGELAVRERYLTPHQLERLLNLQAA